MTLTKQEVRAILTTLEKIEVRGFDNMNSLMALIQLFRSKQKEEEKDG